MNLKEYNKKYGAIPKDFRDRLLYLIETLNFKDKDVVSLNNAMKKLSKMEYTTYTIVFYFVPKGTPRPRYSGITRMFYVKDAANYKKIFGDFVKYCDDLKDIITTPCIMKTETFSPLPENMTKVEKVLSELKLIHNISKPDFDNLGKTYADMVTDHLILDDSIIYKGIVEKFYSSKPRIEITFKVMDKFDCKYNKRKVEKWKNFDESNPRITKKDSIF